MPDPTNFQQALEQLTMLKTVVKIKSMMKVGKNKEDMSSESEEITSNWRDRMGLGEGIVKRVQETKTQIVTQNEPGIQAIVNYFTDEIWRLSTDFNIVAIDETVRGLKTKPTEWKEYC